MVALSIEIKETRSLKIREQIVEFLKINLAIKPLQFFYKTEYKNIEIELASLPNETIGSELYKMLKNNDLKVIPRFENHDLKHIILGYGMTSIEEIKMQAYVFGNGNRSVSCTLFLASGLIFPEYWNCFYRQYKKGKKSSTNINNLSFTKSIVMKTETLKNIYN